MASKKKYIFGIILVLVGALLLVQSLGLDELFFEYLIPGGLIALGIWLIMRKRHDTGTRAYYDQSTDQSTAGQPYGPPPPPPPGPKVGPSAQGNYRADAAGPAETESSAGRGQSSFQSGTHESRQHWQTSDGPQVDPTGKLKYSRVIGDIHIDLNGVIMQSVEVSSGVGDVQIKLMGGELAKGLNRIIISTFVGDVRLFVPRDMAVFAHCSNFVGDIDLEGRRASGFGNNVDSRTPDYDTAEKKLYIACNTFVGDVMITRI